MSARLLVAMIAICTLGCAPSLTEIVVVADTDLDVPSGIDAIRISVTDASGNEQEGLADLRGGAPRPATLGLVSRGGEGRLEVVVIGERGGIEILRRTARVSFARGRTLALRMDLWQRCVAELCGADRACGDAGCRSVDVAMSELSDWTGAPPPPPDAAVEIDAGIDAARYGDASHPRDAWAAPDAWRADTGADAFSDLDAAGGDDADLVPDAWLNDAWTAECAADAECDDGWSCTADACTFGRCTHDARDAACDDGIACTSERCDAALGCVYAANDAACDDGVQCTTNTCDRLLGCITTPLHASCASGSYCDGTTGCTVAPTFTDIYSGIISVRCTPCHIINVPRSGTLDMGSQSVAHTSLVGTIARCGAGVNTRVIPGDSAHSLLWRKVAGVDLCGVRMPRMLAPLDDAQIAQIAHWIDSGALP